jgi:16S rRNA (uracil1498-N3)-methyltransferase
LHASHEISNLGVFNIINLCVIIETPNLGVSSYKIMRLTRIYLPCELLSSTKDSILLNPKSSNHLLNVLRLKIADELIVFNGKGGEFKAKISAIENKKMARIEISEFIESDRESPLKIYLGQGISRGEKMDYTIQKAVELGVYAITPLFTEYCNIKLEGERLKNRVEHWQNVAISAAEQSHRCFVPNVLTAQKVENWLAENFSDEKNKKFVLDPKGEITFADLDLSGLNQAKLLIGSEGGLSDFELKTAKENGFVGIRLGPRILRTETAALAAISVLQYSFGDFHS